MSVRNSFANKQLRRIEREDHAARMTKKRSLQARMMELTFNQPDGPEGPGMDPGLMLPESADEQTEVIEELVTEAPDEDLAPVLSTDQAQE